MSPLFRLADAQMVPLQPFSPKGHGRPPLMAVMILVA